MDADGDGGINSEGDYALPVGYPRNTDSIVSAHFTATIQNWPSPPPDAGTLMVRAAPPPDMPTYQPYYFVVPPTPVTLTGTDLYLPPTTVTNPFPGTVNYGLLAINWAFSNNGGLSWMTAGHTENELYVPLNKPTISPIYHTLINISVPWAAGVAAANEPTVIAATWAHFQTRALTTKHFNPVLTGKRLSYYKEWDATADNATDLLQNLDGQCGAFDDLFPKSIRAAGAKTTPMAKILVASKTDDEEMITNYWAFTGEGTSGNATYPFQDTLANQNPLQITRKNATTGEWEYFWGAIEEVTYVKGNPGQNTPNPKADFINHWLLEIGGKLYDPSYGHGPYDNLAAWELDSVSGFAMLNLAANPPRVIFRMNPPEADIKEIDRIAEP